MTQAYRGYLIRQHALVREVWVEKDGTLICWCASVTEAKTQIDRLLE